MYVWTGPKYHKHLLAKYGNHRMYSRTVPLNLYWVKSLKLTRVEEPPVVLIESTDTLHNSTVQTGWFKQGQVWKSKIEVNSRVWSLLKPLLGLWTVALLLPLHVIFFFCACVPLSLSVSVLVSKKDANQIGLGPTLTPSIYLNYFFKMPISKIKSHSVGVRAST